MITPTAALRPPSAVSAVSEANSTESSGTLPWAPVPFADSLVDRRPLVTADSGMEDLDSEEALQAQVEEMSKQLAAAKKKQEEAKRKKKQEEATSKGRAPCRAPAKKDEGLSEYELQRLRNMESNNEILTRLGLDKPIVPKKRGRGRPPKQSESKKQAHCQDKVRLFRISTRTHNLPLTSAMQMSQLCGRPQKLRPATRTRSTFPSGSELRMLRCRAATQTVANTCAANVNGNHAR